MEFSLENFIKNKICSRYLTGLAAYPAKRKWMLLVLFIVSHCIPSINGLGEEFTVANYPKGDISIPYGSPLDILCVTQNYSSHDLEFTLSGRVLPKIIVNDTAIRLHIENPEIQKNKYMCKNTASRRICVTLVLVDVPPVNVTDFGCISHDLEMFICSWTYPKTKSLMQFNLSYVFNGLLLKCDFIDRTSYNSSSNLYYCTLGVSGAKYKQNLRVYEFNLTSSNHFGRIEQNFTVDHFSVVKPKPPSPIKVLNVTAHSVRLEWNISHNLYDFVKSGYDHKIEFQADEIDNKLYFHKAKGVELLPQRNRTYTFLLDNLPYAFTLYEVRIYVKPKVASEKFWSNFTYVIFRTKSEIPPRPPVIPPGAFDILCCASIGTIEIYWQQLEEREASGPNLKYSIQVSQQNPTLKLSPLITENIYIPDTRLNFNYSHSVSVKAVNDAGESKDSSSIFIPSLSDTKLLNGITSFTKLAYTNGTNELIWMWNLKNVKIDNYTLFWCRFNVTGNCYGRLNYTIIESYRKNYTIHLESYQKYRFALSANKGIYSSGMVWAGCELSKGPNMNYNIDVTLAHKEVKGTSVEITWEMACIYSSDIVTGYIIEYCPIIDTSTSCDETVGYNSVEIKDTATITSYNITNLLYHRTYMFQFILNTTNGTIKIKDATDHVTTQEGIPSHPTNITISDIKHDSVVISFDPPQKRNGNIVLYIITNYGKVFYNDTHDLPDNRYNRRSVKITGLKPLTDYAWNVKACNKHCSEQNENDTLFIKTTIGPPTEMQPPETRDEHGFIILMWNSTDAVDFYQIKEVIKDKDIIYNTTETSFKISVCKEGSHYFVRGVNIDEDPTSGARTNNTLKVILPVKADNVSRLEYPGKWSTQITVACHEKNLVYMLFIFFFIFVIGGVSYISVKGYKTHKKEKILIPVLPEGLIVLDEEIPSKLSFKNSDLNHKYDQNSEEKSLLPYDIKSELALGIKKSEDNYGISNNTDSTAVSCTSRPPTEREASTSDESPECSLEAELIKSKEKKFTNSQETYNLQNAPEKSHLVSDELKRNVQTGYVQHTVPTSSNIPRPKQSQLEPNHDLNRSSSYVIAGIDPTISQNLEPALKAPAQTTSSGYVMWNESVPQTFMNLPQLSSSQNNQFGSDLIDQANFKNKHDDDNFQLQMLNAVSNFKPAKQKTLGFKPATSTGYVTAADLAASKLSNRKCGFEESLVDPAILDHNVMSPYAFDRFSWKSNPAEDNLNSLHLDAPTVDTSNN